MNTAVARNELEHQFKTATAIPHIIAIHALNNK